MIAIKIILKLGLIFYQENVTWEIQAFRGYLFHLSNLFRDFWPF